MYNARVAARPHIMLTLAVLVQLFKSRHAPGMFDVVLAGMCIKQSWLLSSCTVILSKPTVDSAGVKVERCTVDSCLT